MRTATTLLLVSMSLLAAGCMGSDISDTELLQSSIRGGVSDDVEDHGLRMGIDPDQYEVDVSCSPSGTNRWRCRSSVFDEDSLPVVTRWKAKLADGTFSWESRGGYPFD